MEDLKSRIYRLVAEMDCIDEKDITVEYIRQQREKFLYPTVRYYEEGLVSLTRNEFEEMETRVNEKQKEILNINF